MLLYVIRHGETAWNVARRMQGHSDIDLDEEGIRIAERTAAGMRNIPFDLCLTSPLKRARHTAELVLNGREVPILEDERLMEISFGEWEGRVCAGEHREVPASFLDAFYQGTAAYQPPRGGESFAQVTERLGGFYRELLCDQKLQEKTILISTHGCALRALLQPVYPAGSDFWQGAVPKNCAVSVVEVRDGVGTLLASDRLYYEPATPEKC